MTHQIGEGRWRQRRSGADARRHGLYWVTGIILLGLVKVGVPLGASAAGVVGSGTPDSCTEAALDAALAGGGLVTFSCGPDLVQIMITSTKTISADTTIDGGGLIEIHGGNSVGVFSVNTGVRFTVENLTIAGGKNTNHVGVGGGAVLNSGTLTVTSSTFLDNSADNGGGIFNNSGTLTVTDSTFAYNSTTFGGGGAIYNSLGTINVTNSTFTENAGSSGGGAISNFGTATITNSVLIGNRAEGGGGIATEGDALTVTNSTFAGNIAEQGPGGAIATGGGTATVTDSTFVGNRAEGGGGIASSGTLSVTSSTFAGNSADNGGGIFNNGGTLTVTNSTFASNTANGTGGNYGGAIANAFGALTVTNSTFVGNSADRGGAIDNPGNEQFWGVATLRNTILATSTSGGNCFGAITDGGHNIDDGTTCGFAGTSLSNTNPMLTPAGLVNNGGPTQTIALLPNSPAINAGNPNVCATAPVNNLDQRGYVRPGTGYATCSIGAYEYNSPGPPAGCVGDCGGDGAVTVTDLIKMVNIALDVAALDTCTAGDANGDGTITITEIIAGVNDALSGCGG